MAFVALTLSPRNLLVILHIFVYLSSFTRDLSHSTPAYLNCETLYVSQLLANPNMNEYSHSRINRRSTSTKPLSSDMKLTRGLHIAMNFSISLILISLSNDISLIPVLTAAFLHHHLMCEDLPILDPVLRLMFCIRTSEV